MRGPHLDEAPSVNSAPSHQGPGERCARITGCSTYFNASLHTSAVLVSSHTNLPVFDSVTQARGTALFAVLFVLL